MSQLNDISLVAQVVVFKNTRAFDQLVKEYQSPIRRFFLNLTCGDSELSDDLAQDTFIKVTSEDGRKALRESVASLVASVRSVLEKCPPELSADIVDKGIYLTGGGALLDGISQVLKDETGIDTYVAEQPLDCVALGTGKALIDLNKLRPGSIVGNGSL